METIAEVVEHLGGAKEVGKRLDVTPQSVSAWSRRGHIPWRHRLAVQALIREKGGEISLEEIGDLRGRSNGHG